MRIDVLTLFPESIEPFFSVSIMGRAVEAGLVSVSCVNFRDFATDKHRSVDDRPFGGGPGMVLMCGPVFDALAHVERQAPDMVPTRIMLTPQGEPLTQSLLVELSEHPWLIVLCGHYEGFDERIRQGAGVREISIGDYVVSGGEAAAVVLIDGVVRLLPGALGHECSVVDESFAGGLLEYPQYTRPREFRDMKVPEVLLSGNHAEIAAWRLARMSERTIKRRPDMITGEDRSSMGGAPN